MRKEGISAEEAIKEIFHSDELRTGKMDEDGERVGPAVEKAEMKEVMEKVAIKEFSNFWRLIGSSFDEPEFDEFADEAEVSLEKAAERLNVPLDKPISALWKEAAEGIEEGFFRS